MGTFSIWHWLIVLLIAFPTYFLPAIIASARGHTNEVAIWVLNALAGWTGLGWVAMLIWAFAL